METVEMKQKSVIEKVKLSHRKINTEIIINASVEQIWSVLKDTSTYKDWAVFLVDIQGNLVDGSTITAKFQLDPNKNKFNYIEHKIQVEEGSSFYWAEKGPLGIHDNHHFRIEAIDDISSRFIQSDELTKGATFLLGGYLSKVYVAGYDRFNVALKNEVERRLSTRG